jgi:hypothetical protein
MKRGYPQSRSIARARQKHGLSSQQKNDLAVDQPARARTLWCIVRACELNGLHSNVREAARQQTLRAAIEPWIAQYYPVRVTCELLEMARKLNSAFCF